MSLAILTKATVTHLRTALAFGEPKCGAQPEPGQPPADAPEQYVAVWGRGVFVFGGNEQSQRLEETYELGVTISQRIANCPRDRVADTIIVKATTGFDALARKVLVNLHASWSLITAANALLPGVNGFLETLVGPSFIPAATPVDGEWFAAEPAQWCGLALQMMFRGAKRVQDSVGAT